MQTEDQGWQTSKKKFKNKNSYVLINFKYHSDLSLRLIRPHIEITINVYQS